AVLGLSSLAGGLATSPEMLIAARVFQGLATAAVTPAGLSLLTTSFPEGPLRQKALGLNGALMSAGFTTGAILGGVLTDLLSWRWAFFINVPVALAVLFIAPTVIKESRPSVRPKLDLPGATAVTLGLLALIYGLTQAGEHGWGSAGALGWLAAGVVLLVAFYAIESKSAAPLVPVSVLKKKTVAWGNIAGLIAFLTETSLVFLMTLYLQEVLDFSPLTAGLSFGVLGIGTVIGGSIAPRVIAATNTPDHEQGMATGLATMTQQIGITMGTPIMSAIAAAHTDIHAGITTAVIVNTAIVVVGILTTVLFLRTERSS
ncbi:MFS transporter, partial [Streptomyces virginiae]|uniref:MFS transporter n=1 Tax=Streptomyces virginiae TaxID=1961 RepID=UPI000525BEDA